MATRPATVAAWIAAAPKPVRARLREMRALVRAAALPRTIGHPSRTPGQVPGRPVNSGGLPGIRSARARS